MTEQMKQRAEEFWKNRLAPRIIYMGDPYSGTHATICKKELTTLLHQVWEEGYNKGREHTANVQAGMEEIRKVAWEEGWRKAMKDAACQAEIYYGPGVGPGGEGWKAGIEIAGAIKSLPLPEVKVNDK